MKKIITRFAPSPTGFLHVGGVRTALFNYLYAKKHKGDFVLRIEDTDKERNKEEWAEGIVKDLEWLGMKADVFAKQSERTELYVDHLKKLVEMGAAYEAETTRSSSEERRPRESERRETKSPGGDRPRVIRFKNPNKEIKFDDEVRGEIKFDTTELGDFVIARSSDDPLYHLAVVVDDALMNITHVIRAEEHLSNTPRQILILEALDFERPIYAHLPLVLAKDKSKLSKRKHGEAVSLSYYREKGYLPKALINFLALLGWNPGTEREIFSLEELVEEFSLERVQKGGAVFNVEKLNDINKHYIKELNLSSFKDRVLGEVPKNIKDLALYSPETLEKVLPLIQERATNKDEAQKELVNLSFFFQKPLYEASKLVWKDTHTDKVKEHLNVIIEILESIPDKEYNETSIKDKVFAYADKEGRGEVLWPMRFALSGQERSPDPFTIVGILGKTETNNRLREAISKL